MRLIFTPTDLFTPPGGTALRPGLLALGAWMALVVTGGPALAEQGAGQEPTPGANEKKDEPSQPPENKIDGGDTAWMLGSTGLVLLMVPGLALFYGGMVRRKNVLGTMMHSMVCLAIVGIQWVAFGYALAFGESQNGWIGWSPEFLGL